MGPNGHVHAFPFAAQIFLASAFISGSDFTPSVQTLPFQFMDPASCPFSQYTLHVLPSLLQEPPFEAFRSWQAEAGDAMTKNVAAMTLNNANFMDVFLFVRRSRDSTRRVDSDADNLSVTGTNSDPRILKGPTGLLGFRVMSFPG